MQLVPSQIRQEAHLIVSSNTHSKALTPSSCSRDSWVYQVCSEKARVLGPLSNIDPYRQMSLPEAVRCQEAGLRVQQTLGESQSRVWEKETMKPTAESLLSVGPSTRLFNLQLL